MSITLDRLIEVARGHANGEYVDVDQCRGRIGVALRDFDAEHGGPKRLKVGSRCEGSLRNEDCAQACLDMAREVGLDVEQVEEFAYLTNYLGHKAIVDEADGCDDESGDCIYCEDAEVSEGISAALEALEEYAPPYCYVGNTEGDGASLGVWPSKFALDEATRRGVALGDGRLFDPEEFVILDWNDHGNLTVTRLIEAGAVLELV